MWPPIGFFGSAVNIAAPSTCAMTWFVTKTRRLYCSESLIRDDKCCPSCCYLSASSPRPVKSALKSAVIESITMRENFCFTRSWGRYVRACICYSWLNTRATMMLLSVCCGSAPNRFAICVIRSGLNVDSVSMYTTLYCSCCTFPLILGCWPVTASVWHNWDLPDLNSP